MKNGVLISFKQVVNLRWMLSLVAIKSWICKLLVRSQYGTAGSPSRTRRKLKIIIDRFFMTFKSVFFFQLLVVTTGSAAYDNIDYWQYSHFSVPFPERQKIRLSAEEACNVGIDLLCSECSLLRIDYPQNPLLGTCIVSREGYDDYGLGFVRAFSCGQGEIFDSTKRRCIPEGSEDEGGSCPKQYGGTNPINLAVGNKYQDEVDFIGRENFPLKVVRAFNSISGEWQFFSGLSYRLDAAKAISIRNDGKKVAFFSNEFGEWIANQNITARLENLDDAAGGGNSWRYTTLDHTVEDYDAHGRLVKTTHRSGLSHTYVYNASNIVVTHSQGDALIYDLDGSSRITGFTDPNSNHYNYGYDANDRLTSMTYPNSGGMRTYHYEDVNYPNAITGITDENGDRFATWAYDSAGRAISSEHHGGAEKVTIDYTHIDDETDPRSVATNALGKQTTYHFANIFGARKVTQVEGHPSTNCAAANKNYSYDANGFLASKTDWKGNTTTYVRNTKGQELSRTEASGTAEARTITTEWHPTFNLRTKVTEPDRETVYGYDANGNLLSQQTNDLTTS